ncbi:hypothetical protein ABT160_26980 [Streptomyces sp. NPDC001941]|uniref:hypothetical protein n=1 Tax=Streptomyces sp. NPDC001941 TaxID=3154659 RepID=UPI0033169317
MDAIQQHLFDTYRAARLGTPQPPAPGRHDVAVYRSLNDYRRFRAIVAPRRPAPLLARLRDALAGHGRGPLVRTRRP